MQTRRRVLALALLLGLAVIPACLPGSAAALNVPGTTHFTGQNNVWHLSDSPVMVSGSPTVDAGATLTIEPGVVVKFRSGAFSNGTELPGGSLRILGTLHADGTQDRRITFTSKRDDSVGGDADSTGPTNGSPGDWDALQVAGTATFDYVDIRYGAYYQLAPYTSTTGALEPKSAIWVSQGGNATINHARITDNQQNGIGVAQATATVSNSLLARNTRGLSTSRASVTLDHSTIRDSGDIGAYFYLMDSSQGPNHIHDSNITRSQTYGLYVKPAVSPPAVAVPYGAANNIYNNQLGSSNSPTELYIPRYPTGVNWTGNFWGVDVRYGDTAAGCPGGLVDNLGFGPDYPIRKSTVSGCRVDNVPIGPNEFSQTRIDNGAYDDYTYFDGLGLVERYLPQLRYHFIEAYRADSARTATLPLTFSGSDGPDESNNLEREDGAILAAANPLLGYPVLSLDLLPAETGDELYPSGAPALDSDRIDFRNSAYENDAATMHSDPDLANRIYSRSVRYADGKIWLQYWFFYYYNDSGVDPPLNGDHEADWEMIQIGLNGSLTPDVATYAQHNGAESCPWDRVPKYNGPLGVAPVVFVGLGAHTSEFWPSLVESYAAESGSERVRPTIEQQIGDVAPGWANWRGRWGGSEVQTISSPGKQGAKWDNPTGFNDSAGPCPVQASGAVTARSGALPRLRVPSTRRLPAPRLTAKRSGHRAVIRYRFTQRQWNRLPRRAGLVLAVRGNKRGSLPRNVLFQLHRRTGRRLLGLPQSRGPYLVLGQTLGVSGAQSRPVTSRLR